MRSARSSAATRSAPGASSAPLRAPGKYDPLPAVDERLVAPEANAEIVDGVVYETMGSLPPHALQHSAVTRIFVDCLAPGYEAAVDMLTRADKKTDAAPDVSIFPVGADPKTGGRRLEELALEVVYTESLEHVTTKTRKLAKRGVRRLFYLHVDERALYEWRHKKDRWERLGEEEKIEDACFVVPIPVRALADRVLADDTVAHALLATGNRVLAAALAERELRGEQRGELRGEQRGEQRGELRGRRETLRALAKAAGLALSPEDHARIDACDDPATLDRWVANGLRATSSAALFS